MGARLEFELLKNVTSSRRRVVLYIDRFSLAFGHSKCIEYDLSIRQREGGIAGNAAKQGFPGGSGLAVGLGGGYPAVPDFHPLSTLRVSNIAATYALKRGATEPCQTSIHYTVTTQRFSDHPVVKFPPSCGMPAHFAILSRGLCNLQKIYYFGLILVRAQMTVFDGVLLELFHLQFLQVVVSFMIVVKLGLRHESNYLSQISINESLVKILQTNPPGRRALNNSTISGRSSRDIEGSY
jgi:hypothetical protein